MFQNTLSQYSDDSRIWVYGFDRVVADSEVIELRRDLIEFVTEWKSHQHPVRGGFDIKYNIFVILFAECMSGISGCSIDSSVRTLKQLGVKYLLNPVNLNLVYFRAGDRICIADRARFQTLIDQNEVDRDTIVFNNTLQTVGQFRSGQWETKLRNSWHNEAFDFSGEDVVSYPE